MFYRKKPEAVGLTDRWIRLHDPEVYPVVPSRPSQPHFPCRQTGQCGHRPIQYAGRERKGRGVLGESTSLSSGNRTRQSSSQVRILASNLETVISIPFSTSFVWSRCCDLTVHCLESEEADEVVKVVVLIVGGEDAVPSAAACRRSGWACKWWGNCPQVPTQPPKPTHRETT
jgi:hypothetical protein